MHVYEERKNNMDKSISPDKCCFMPMESGKYTLFWVCWKDWYLCLLNHQVFSSLQDHLQHMHIHTCFNIPLLFFTLLRSQNSWVVQTCYIQFSLPTFLNPLQLGFLYHLYKYITLLKSQWPPYCQIPRPIHSLHSALPIICPVMWHCWPLPSSKRFFH